MSAPRVIELPRDCVVATRRMRKRWAGAMITLNDFYGPDGRKALHLFSDASDEYGAGEWNLVGPGESSGTVYDEATAVHWCATGCLPAKDGAA